MSRQRSDGDGQVHRATVERRTRVRNSDGTVGGAAAAVELVAATPRRERRLVCWRCRRPCRHVEPITTHLGAIVRTECDGCGALNEFLDGQPVRLNLIPAGAA